MKYISDKAVKKFKVCILAAGIGSRNTLSKYSHKALLSINYKAAISNIIELYPKKTQFVLAVSHNSKLISEYLNIVKPDYDFKFVKIKKSSGSGSGPGKSLLECRKFLQCPFIFHSCDTLIKNNSIPLPTFNWIGYDFTQKKNDYVCLKYTKNIIDFFVSSPKRSKAFIGISGIKDYKIFWKSLENTKHYSNLINKKQKKYIFEKQTIDGFQFLKNDLLPIKFNWFDIGNDQAFLNTKKEFEKNKNTYPLQKDEFLYFENNKVVKLFKNSEIPRKIKMRSNYIKKYLPGEIRNKGNFLSYNFTEGKALMKIKNKKIFKNVTTKLFKNFWLNKKLNKREKLIFNKQCFSFYKKKTYGRINLFLKNLKEIDNLKYINGIKVPKIKSILNNINWIKLSNGVPANFHGDTSISNIIVENSNKFTLIDWRDSFGKLVSYGDVYYDLAKLYHTLKLSHLHLDKNFHEIKITKNRINMNLKRIKYLEYNLKIFSEQIIKMKFDISRVKLLSWIILLNSAALHTNRTSAMIYFLTGKVLLFKELKKIKFNKNQQI